MDISEIVDYFSMRFPEFNIKAIDFTRPDKQAWQKIFTLLVCNIVRTSPDVIKQGVGLIDVQLDYPELHEDSNYSIRLLSAMQLIGKLCRFDFDVTDLQDPKPKRLQRICANIIQFLDFRDSKQQLFEKIKNENDIRLSQYHKVVGENEQLKSQINAMRFERSKQEPEIARLKADIEKQSEHLASLTKQSVEKKKKLDELKSAINQAQATSERLNEALQKEKEEGDKLEELIVPSPEKLRFEMDRLRNELLNTAKARQDKSLAMSELHQRINRLEQYDTELAPMLLVAKSIEKECITVKELKVELSKVMAVKDAELLKLRDARQKAQQLLEQVRLAGERHQRLETQGEAKVRAKQQEIDKMMADLEMLRSGKLACEKANEKYAEELRLIRKQLIDIECEHNTMMADLQQCRHDLDLACNAYNITMRSVYKEYLIGCDLPLDTPSPILPV